MKKILRNFRGCEANRTLPCLVKMCISRTTLENALWYLRNLNITHGQPSPFYPKVQSNRNVCLPTKCNIHSIYSRIPRIANHRT